VGYYDTGGVFPTHAFLYTPALYQLSVSKSGTGTVKSGPAGITCGFECSQSYAEDMVVTLTATADPGSGFTSWTGCDAVNVNACTLTMNAARSVTAYLLLMVLLIVLSVWGLRIEWHLEVGWQQMGQITTSNPEGMAVSSSFLYGDFGLSGIWKWDGSKWGQITTSNPEGMAVSSSFLYGTSD